MPKSKRRAEAYWNEAKQCWQINVQKNGVRKSFYASNPSKVGKHEAEDKADEWLKRKSSGYSPRLEAAWKDYMDDMLGREKVESHKKADSVWRNYIKPNVQNYKLEDITPTVWRKCVDACIEKGNARRTCRNVLSAITGFLAFCKRNRWDAEQLELGDIVIPATARVGKRKVLQPDGMKTLFTVDTVSHYRKPVHAYYIHAWRFLVLSGLRRGEECGLKWSDIKGDRLYITRSINQALTMTAGKNDNARRCVALGKRAIAVLEDQKDMLKQLGIVSPWVFPDQKTRKAPSPRKLYKSWYAYRNQHGLEASLHELRHTFVSAVKADMPEPLLKSMIGHSEDMDTFGTYGHEVEGDISQTATIVDTVFDRLISK